MQNLSQNELKQIPKMQNLSQNKLEKIAKMRHIKNYKNMSRRIINYFFKIRAKPCRTSQD